MGGVAVYAPVTSTTQNIYGRMTTMVALMKTVMLLMIVMIRNINFFAIGVNEVRNHENERTRVQVGDEEVRNPDADADAEVGSDADADAEDDYDFYMSFI